MKTVFALAIAATFLAACGGGDGGGQGGTLTPSPSPLLLNAESRPVPTAAPISVPVPVLVPVLLPTPGVLTPASVSPTALPSINFSMTNNAAAGARPVPDCTPTGGGVRYDVGSGAYPTLNSIPWNTLLPDDVVCVPYRAQPYFNKIYFITRGAPGHPIRMVGLRGPNGERPIIDGNNATTSPVITPVPSDAFLQDLGLISFHYHFLKPVGVTAYGWHPGYITVTGFQVRNAGSAYTYRDAAGATRRYGAPNGNSVYDNFAAGFYINSGDNIVIEDCEINDNGIGIFVNSHPMVTANSPAELTAHNITIRGNYIHANGDTTHLGIHNIYVEAYGVNIIGNYFDHKAGNVGTNIKSRSSHERIYANYIRGGSQSELMLIDPQSGWNPLGTQSDFNPTVLAGNVIENPIGSGTNQGIVKFGSDSYFKTLPSHNRQTLLMVHNTVFEYGHGARTQILYPVDSTGLGIRVSQYLANNLIVNLWDAVPNTAANEFSMASGDGSVFLSTNWIASNVVKVGQYSPLSVNSSVSGWGTNGSNPLLMGTLFTDPRPAANSPLVDAATPLLSLPAGSMASTVTDYALY